MAFEADQAVALGFLGKRIFQLLGGQAEGDVHDRARFRLGMAAVEAAAFVNGGVDRIRFFAVDLLDLGQAAELLGPLEDQSHHVDGECGRGVVQGAAGGQRLVIEHDRQVGRRALDQVIADNDHGHTGRPGVLLGAGIQHGILRDVERAADEIGRGIADQGNAGRRGRLSEIFHAMDGLVGCEVQVGSVRVEVEIVGQAIEALLLGVGGGASGTQLGSFLDGRLAPGAGDDVVGGGTGGAQVHRQHGELQSGAALQEHDLVIAGDAQQLAQVCFGGLDHSFEFLRAVTDLHHRHACALEVDQLGLCLLEDLERQDGWAWVKVEDAFGHGKYSCI